MSPAQNTGKVWTLLSSTCPILKFIKETELQLPEQKGDLEPCGAEGTERFLSWTVAFVVCY